MTSTRQKQRQAKLERKKHRSNIRTVEIVKAIRAGKSDEHMMSVFKLSELECNHWRRAVRRINMVEKPKTGIIDKIKGALGRT